MHLCLWFQKRQWAWGCETVSGRLKLEAGLHVFALGGVFWGSRQNVIVEILSVLHGVVCLSSWSPVWSENLVGI